MNRKIATIALSATLAGGIGAVAVPASGAFADGLPGTVSQTDERPSKAQVEKQLMAKTNTARVAVVEGVGYSGDPVFFGAVVTGRDTVEFYVNPGDDWSKSAERSILDTPFGDDVEVRGSNVEGLQYPVFVVDGGFTGNGSGNSLAFAHDYDRGWGVLEGKGDQLIPSGHGITELGAPGLEIGIDFNQRGSLVTRSLWGPDYDASNAEQGNNPIVRTWKGTGGDNLTMTSENGGPTG